MSKIEIAIYLIIYVTYTLDFVVKICNVTQMSSIVYWLARWASKQLIAGSNLGLCKSFYFFFFLKWDKKWVYCWISFSECEKKVKLALIDFKWSSREWQNTNGEVMMGIRSLYTTGLLSSFNGKAFFWFCDISLSYWDFYLLIIPLICTNSLCVFIVWSRVLYRWNCFLFFKLVNMLLNDFFVEGLVFC